MNQSYPSTRINTNTELLLFFAWVARFFLFILNPYAVCFLDLRRFVFPLHWRRKKVHLYASVFQILKFVLLSNLDHKEKNIWQFYSPFQSKKACACVAEVVLDMQLVTAQSSFAGIHIQVSYPSVSPCRHLSELNDLCLSKSALYLIACFPHALLMMTFSILPIKIVHLQYIDVQSFVSVLSTLIWISIS